LSSNSSSGSSRHRRSTHSKKRGTRANAFPYAPQPVQNPWLAASNADPLKSLESRLLPHDSRSTSTSYYSSSAYTFLPPVLHAGWAINEDALLEWCTSEGFDRTTYDIDDRPVFDYRSTVASALSYLAQRSGLSSFHSSSLSSSTANRGSSDSDSVDIFPYVQSTCSQRAPIIVALVSNYDIEGVKQLGFIKSRIYAFGRLLFREGLLLDADCDASPADASWSKSSNPSIESPKWYLDYEEWQWIPVPREGLGLSKPSPTLPIDVRLKVKVSVKNKASNSALRSAY